MDCHNHAGTPASGTCAGCAEAFCPACLVAIKGTSYCGACKTMAVTVAPSVTLSPCPEAAEALKFAIIGIFCMGIILEPIAISKALKARKRLEEDPTLTGHGQAKAALIIATVALVLWVMGTFGRAIKH
ncbi:MAG: hypothetical protein HY901_22375 [Deltaproteobacteria bacterium]|nr:hypothetical protein [Deltaproteobacteria bacterium]